MPPKVLINPDSTGKKIQLMVNQGGDEHAQLVIGGHHSIDRREWRITAAKTNFALRTATTGQLLAVLACSAYLTANAPADIDVRIGFGATTLPAGVDTGVAGIILSHELTPGSWAREGDATGLVGIGADAEDLRLTCDDPRQGGSAGELIILATTLLISPT